jgi:preprotein translocase subunit SecE
MDARKEEGMTDTNALVDDGSDKDDKNGKGAKKRSPNRSRGNVFSRLALFVRQVVAELRKVIWPTRKELVAYTTVVVVFVVIMASIVAGLDFIFTRAVLFVFG